MIALKLKRLTVKNLTGNNLVGCLYLYTSDTSKNPDRNTLTRMIMNLMNYT